jgi:serine/threonine protein kinase
MPCRFSLPVQSVQWGMSPGVRPAVIQPPKAAEEGTIKSWLDALASGNCDAPAFLRAMQGKFSAAPDGTWEALSQLDQYYRRGRIDADDFKTIKSALAESVLGPSLGPAANSGARAAPPAREVPVARHILVGRDLPVAQDIAAREVPVARHTPVSRDLPVAQDIAAREIAVHDIAVARGEQTDAHSRREETQSSDSVGEPQAGTVLRRRYRIEAVIGQGGMGTVFQVLDEFRLDAPGTQRLAVKVLHPAVAKRAELLAELRREFQSLQMLSHPNIIRVFDFDRDGPLVFFTMELLIGAPLTRILQARKFIPLERPQALAILRDVGAALSYAHSRGAVHGDLTLHNIFITGSGELRVMSFGVSHNARQRSQAPDPEMTLPHAASNYASCQVLDGERADARDDVFSLACIAYMLLSGAHPFQKSTAIEARGAKLRLRRPANLSGRQWRALRSALRWEREKRPADVQRWLSELEVGGAVKKLAPLNDLMEPPAAKQSKSWLAFLIGAGVAALLFAAYWLISNRDMLPSVDSTASIRAPAAPAPPVSAPHVSTPTASAPPASAPPASAPVLAPTSHVAPAAAPNPPRSVAAPVAGPVAGPAPAGASKVELAADTVDVPAGQASAQITVHRRGSLRGETSFTWWTESGTAKPRTDFSAVVPQLAYFADGNSNVSLSIPLSIAPHAQAKSFYVVIDRSEGGAALGARTLTMVTMLPRD